MFKKISRYLIVLELIGFLFCPGLLLAKTANDPLNGFQYYLDPIQAEAAWDYTTGSRSVVVAVIDTGVDIDHPDIYENIWRNIDEVPGDGIDNDHNGYIDDYQGWDFVNDEADPNPKFDSEYSELGLDHGTMVAGIIGARGNNNYGLTGINWEVSIMPLLALNGNGSGENGVVAAAIDYAIANGADIINLSLVEKF
jgi:subtilisin family serine protease